MKLFKGLSENEIRLLHHCGSVRPVIRGEVLFREGDPAHGLFTVMDGAIEIVKETGGREVVLSQLGRDDVFGEMGLLWDAGTRTATARAATDATVFEIRGNPIETMRKVRPISGVNAFVKNLICVLGERLRHKTAPDAARARSELRSIEGYEPDPGAALATIEEHLPAGLLRRFMTRKALKIDEYLCVEGDAPDGFYFIHSGALDVLKEDVDTDGEEPRLVSIVEAPAIVGEVGFFSGEPRSVSLCAVEPVTYTHFTGGDFARLEKNAPEEAYEVLCAAAQLTVHLILAREEA